MLNIGQPVIMSHSEVIHCNLLNAIYLMRLSVLKQISLYHHEIGRSHTLLRLINIYVILWISGWLLHWNVVQTWYECSASMTVLESYSSAFLWWFLNRFGNKMNTWIYRTVEVIYMPCRAYLHHFTHFFCCT